MSLMQWLTVGRSFSDAQEKPSRYRMTSLNLVPNFGVENRKSGSEIGESVSIKLSESEVNQPLLLSQTSEPSLVPKEEEPLTPEESPSTEQQGKEEATPFQAKTDSEETSAFARRHAKRGWSFIKNPFKRTKEAPAKRVRQGELTLEGVKPIRNTLCDSDLEFVLQAPPTPDPAPENGRPLRFGLGYWKGRVAKLFRRQTT